MNGMEQKTLAAGEISEPGWQKLYLGFMEEKTKLRELYEKDIVGFFSEIHSFLGMEIPDGKKGTEVLGELDAVLKAEVNSFDIEDRILCLVTEYGIAEEKDGFRRGFQTAMRIGTSGMNGGVI